MRIEVFEDIEGAWRWRIRSNGRITAQGESHTSRADAIRAAKGVVRAVCKPTAGPGSDPILFTTTTAEKSGITTITWA